MDTIYSINSFTRTMPLVIHAAASYAWGDNWVFSADLEQASGNEMGYTDKTQFSAGAQFNPIGILPLRAGMTLGGKWGFLFGMGFGCCPWCHRFSERKLSFLFSLCLSPHECFEGPSLRTNEGIHF